jgi:hypothetical protein
MDTRPRNLSVYCQFPQFTQSRHRRTPPCGVSLSGVSPKSDTRTSLLVLLSESSLLLQSLCSTGPAHNSASLTRRPMSRVARGVSGKMDTQCALYVQPVTPIHTMKRISYRPHTMGKRKKIPKKKISICFVCVNSWRRWSANGCIE